MPQSDFRQYIPIKLMPIKHQTLVQWIDCQTASFTEPFLHQTLQHLMANQANLRLTPLSQLEDLPQTVAPTGFIFHCGRCGSTLVSQMLSALPHSRVISEAALLNQALRCNTPQPQRHGLISHLIHAMGPALEAQALYFIKFSSWNCCYIETLRQLYPQVPIAFIYRDPLEVIVSLEKRPASWLNSKATSILPTLTEHTSPVPTTQIEQIGAVLQANLNQVLRCIDDNFILINYTQLPAAVFTHLLPFFDVEMTEEVKQQLQQTSQWYAKDRYRSQPFTSDYQQKQAAITQEMRRADSRYTRHLYNLLEEHPQNIVRL